MAEFLYIELKKIGMSALLGVGLAVAYDFFRILRVAFKHNTIALSTEDMLFFICITFPVFGFLLEINNGVFRAYLVLGVIFGFMLYRETIGRLLLWIIGNIIRKIRKIAMFLLKKIKSTVTIKDNSRAQRKRRWHSEKKTKN